MPMKDFLPLTKHVFIWFSFASIELLTGEIVLMIVLILFAAITGYPDMNLVAISAIGSLVDVAANNLILPE